MYSVKKHNTLALYLVDLFLVKVQMKGLQPVKMFPLWQPST
jgi:hypothetical protein